ncbi:PAS domain S-box protein [Acidobacteria bacterium AH-259-A15]|nr:PAS domain S-box protein [Acidobacteria bacterium AH-259-A15]
MKSLLRILHLEDDPNDVELVQSMLGAEGIACDVVRVETRADFLAAVKQDGFDLIFADYRLPSFDGMTALAIAREKCPDVPFIVVSGTLGEERAIESLKTGATDYVLKERMSRLVPSVCRALSEAEERSERKRAEIAQQKLLLAVEQTDDVIFMTELDGWITYVNPSFARVYGFTKEEALSKTPRIINSGKMGRDYYTRFWKTILSGKPHCDEQVNKSKDGRFVTVVSTVNPLFDGQGKVLGFVAVQKDVTERKQAQKVQEALYSTTDASVADLIMEKQLDTEKRRISVLFSDLKDFTQFSEQRRPEMVITDLNRLLQEMETILLDYHAHIDKYLGDGIMVEFGAPVDYERHALLAVVAGLKMQERIVKGKFPWQMRIGIATGESIIGLIGHQRQTYTAIGDVVNWASKIQKMCTPEMVTVNASTYEEVSWFVEARRKTVFSFSESDDPEFAEKITHYSTLLDETPDDVDLLKKVGLLFLEANYIFQAHDHLLKAAQMDPEDDKIKLAYAEATLKMQEMDEVSMRGKKNRLHLYEVLGLKNPLLDREKIPQKLYDKYYREVEKALDYPEDIVLPVEATDGSIGHSRVVGFLSYALADALDLAPQEKIEILRAGYLADIGKAIIPHHLLNRPGGLSKNECEEIAKHPGESVRVLRKMGYQNESLFEIIDATHENFNGSGYPVGVSGKDIPLGARIVAVADTYDGLTSWRPYRDRWDYRAAFAEMKRDMEKGKFDPKVVEAFERLLW